MHKCQSTFSAMESGEPEVDLSIDGQSISGTIRITRNCQDCSTECKEYSFDISEDFDAGEHAEHDLDLSNESFEQTEEMQTKDRRGKPIRNPRYMKALYGYSGSVEVICNDCSESVATVEMSDSVQASGMDELE